MQPGRSTTTRAMGLSAVLLLFMAAGAAGQVTIKERMELGTGNQVQPVAVPDSLLGADPFPFGVESNGSGLTRAKTAGPEEEWFVVETGGTLKLFFKRAARATGPIPADAFIEVQIGDRIMQVPVAEQFATALQADNFGSNCPSRWYLYGKGPFKAGYRPSADATVIKGYYKKQTPDEVLQEINYNTRNYGDGWLVAGRVEGYERYAQDRYGQKYLWEYHSDLVYRSFISFAPTARFSGPVEFMETSLRMPSYTQYENTGRLEVAGISSSWEEASVTWDNQPGVSGPTISESFGASRLSINVEPLIETWIKEPSGNYGLRLKLAEEQKTGRRYVRSPSRASSYYPILVLHVNNPGYREAPGPVNVGPVQPGDTVRVSYPAGSRGLADDLYYRGYLRTLPRALYPNEPIWAWSDKDTLRVRDFRARYSAAIPGCTEIYHGFEQIEFMALIGEANDIMLGESKYYAAVKNPDSGEISIEEVETDANEKPKQPANLVSNAFSGNPIEVVSGGKSGVYWERKWAAISDNGSISTGKLPSGVIRLVGRYWEAGNQYKVKLKAAAGTRSGELEITVVKPERLGEDENEKIYTDALQRTYDLDSLAIRYGGKHGIPPQFLKGMVSQESSRKAAYRYEENTDYRYQMNDRDNYPDVRRRMKNNHYWITDKNDEGDPPIPTNHVIYEEQGHGGNYPGFVGTMYDVFLKKRESDIDNRSELKKKSNEIKKVVKRELKEKSVEEDSLSIKLEEISDERLNKWVENEYRGGLSDIAKQTRIVASYGPLQLMYLYGFYENTYPENRDFLPETMNEDVDVGMKYAIKFFINRKFNQPFSNTDVNFSQNKNWPEGFEESLRRGANVYNGNNGSSTARGYGDKIWNWAQKYEPKN